MTEYSTTRLSSKGQVVIPESVRKGLKLKAGQSFVVIGSGDAVILKTIQPPTTVEFRQLLKQARAEARKAGIKRADVKAAIATLRRRSR